MHTTLLFVLYCWSYVETFCEIKDITPPSCADGSLFLFSLYVTEGNDKRKKTKYVVSIYFFVFIIYIYICILFHIHLFYKENTLVMSCLSSTSSLFCVLCFYKLYFRYTCFLIQCNLRLPKILFFIFFLGFAKFWGSAYSIVPIVIDGFSSFVSPSLFEKCDSFGNGWPNIKLQYSISPLIYDN